MDSTIFCDQVNYSFFHFHQTSERVSQLKSMNESMLYEGSICARPAVPEISIDDSDPFINDMSRNFYDIVKFINVNPSYASLTSHPCNVCRCESVPHCPKLSASSLNVKYSPRPNDEDAFVTLDTVAKLSCQSGEMNGIEVFFQTVT